MGVDIGKYWRCLGAEHCKQARGNGETGDDDFVTLPKVESMEGKIERHAAVGNGYTVLATYRLCEFPLKLSDNWRITRNKALAQDVGDCLDIIIGNTGTTHRNHDALPSLDETH
jgi:hypothetical protein